METVRVLVVDDQEPFRLAASAVIEAAAGFELVGVAETGEASVDLAEERRPDLVLMDVHLPGMSGPAATRALRRLEPAPVVFLVSTYDESECDGETQECGASAYIRKSLLEPGLLRRTWEAVRR
ncbi:MAG TPA: response regulator transcription factor [Nocardioidaceae bacterium]|nr:response regulator transcription factor [Nocardioidaceae bacterium]